VTPRLVRAGARGSVTLLPPDPGVYRFRDGEGRVLYVGRAVDLRRRVGSYWSDLGDRKRLRRMVDRIASVEAVVCDSGHEAAWLERNLLERTLPRWNRARGGGESAVFVRLDLRAATSGVALVHTASLAGGVGGARDFGPYLGGNQVRLAVSALNRVYPIGYASERLRGAQQDLAVARRIVPTDRDRLVHNVIAVLERDPVALADVQARLAVRRDEAAGRLAFELAARIQDESAALAWVVAEQKVTSSSGQDVDVYGWRDGLLVAFEIRNGRMSTWSSRPCSEQTARDRLHATPPMWRPFADRNAELAVRLRGHPG
jgi:excinuclease ABC subunit C